MTLIPFLPTPCRIVRAVACLAVSLQGVVFSTAPAAADDRPNVLFIAVDDLRPETGAYGNAMIPTPHLDAIADSGVLFNKAYCQYALCAPSRASLLTGLRPDTTGIYDYRKNPGKAQFDEAMHDARTLPQHFREAGYNTLSVGKIFHANAVDQDAWTEERNAPAPQWPSKEIRDQIKQAEAEAKAKGRGKFGMLRASKGPASAILDLPDHRFKDGAISGVAVDFLKDYAKKDEPFFLAVGFVKPHLPFVAPKRAADRIDFDAVEVPSRDEPKNVSNFALVKSWYDMRHYPDIRVNGDLNDQQTRELIYAYYACVAHVDDQVGRVMKQLERLGVADNTIVVVWGDHGWKLGDYGDWGKHTAMELDARVPLMVRAPGMASGAASDALVELIDLYPTLADLAGLDIPDHVEGTSFAPVLESPDMPWKPGALTLQNRSANEFGNDAIGYSMRTDHFRYTEWRDRATGEVLDVELYDHRDSSLASENLAPRSDYADELERHAALLAGGWRGLQTIPAPEPE
ncbi:MAG: sulfatase [Planctomycetota bacterium]